MGSLPTEDRPAIVLRGDMREVLQQYDDNTFDSVVTDPPYELKFMGRSWDSAGVSFDPATWAECLRVLKPGGHLLAFGGTRTYHRIAVAIEDAGFEIRDTVAWMHGQGFPKSHNVGKAIDKAAGAEREVVGTRKGAGMSPKKPDGAGTFRDDNWTPAHPDLPETAPATPEAEQWDGWGTALKPSFEPIILARKPFKGTVAKNVLEHGTGALNIDASRIDAKGDKLGGGGEKHASLQGKLGWGRPWMDDPEHQESHAAKIRENVKKAEQKGRWPANVLLSHADGCRPVGYTTIKGRVINRFTEGAKPFGNGAGYAYETEQFSDDVVEIYECADGCPVKILDEQSGTLTSGKVASGGVHRRNTDKFRNTYSPYEGQTVEDAPIYGDSGGASRFFFTAKPSKSEKNKGLPDGAANTHSTVKPVAIMRYLIKLVTQPNGLVLDPFAGSGTTGVAALEEGFRVVLIELDKEGEYIPIIKHRLTGVQKRMFRE